MKQKHITFFIVIFSFILLNTLVAFNIYKTKFISKDIFRLHVVANSNSIEDQIIKLKAESKIKEYISSFNINNKNELKNEIEKNKDEILQIANSTIYKNDKNYTSSIKIGKISYDEKDNMQTQMYSGTYDSASVILGSGDGKNIWSIIFPNDKTIEKIKELDTIIPGISNIYNHDEKIETDDKQINSFILDFLNKK